MFTRTFTHTIAMLTPLALSGAAKAAEAGAEGGGTAVVDINWFQFVISILVFGIAFFVLAKTAWPKIIEGLDQRERKIREEIFNAEEARKKADEALAEYEKSLAQARAEANEMIEKTKAEQSRMAAQLKAEAEEELNEMRADARRNIENAKRAALSEIYNEAANVATAVAQRILEREVNESDQQRLVEEAVSEFTNDLVGTGETAEAAS